jgi:hypothetical protein
MTDDNVARGVMYGLAISLPFWATVVWLLVG